MNVHIICTFIFRKCYIMFYKLKPYISLRGWFREPFTYINYNNDLIYKLSKYEMDILKKCDEKNYISKDKTIDLFLNEQIIINCDKNDHIQEWQKYKFCANNCFSTAY